MLHSCAGTPPPVPTIAGSSPEGQVRLLFRDSQIAAQKGKNPENQPNWFGLVCPQFAAWYRCGVHDETGLSGEAQLTYDDEVFGVSNGRRTRRWHLWKCV